MAWSLVTSMGLPAGGCPATFTTPLMLPFSATAPPSYPHAAPPPPLRTAPTPHSPTSHKRDRIFSLLMLIKPVEAVFMPSSSVAACGSPTIGGLPQSPPQQPDRDT